MPDQIRINMVIGEEYPELYAYLKRYSPKSRAEVLRHLASFGLLVTQKFDGGSSSGTPTPAAPPAASTGKLCRKGAVSCISIRLRQ